MSTFTLERVHFDAYLGPNLKHCNTSSEICTLQMYWVRHEFSGSGKLDLKLSKKTRYILLLMYSSLQKDHQRRQCYWGEQRVSGNILNVLSLTDILGIHHFHLDRALITELCRLLNNDLQVHITQPNSLCYFSFSTPVSPFW